YNLDEIITDLYAKSIVQTAAIKLLKEMFFGFVSVTHPDKADVIKKVFDENISKVIEQEVVKTKLKDEYLEHFSQDALNRYLKDLGL
ncbi:MAG TPA: hypothetical protein VHS53_18820, partial [Mucilaginibacter sp.]|nr:hypothetical protein [Mucilaginibacter sp.]